MEMEKVLSNVDSDLIEACEEMLALDRHFLPLLSVDAVSGIVGELVEKLAAAQASPIERICAQPPATWAGLLAKARAALPHAVDPSNPKLPAEERLQAALLRDIAALAAGREQNSLC
jgi:hypothetical protein